MDQERLAQVKSWARGLTESESGSDLRAAGRAILLLVDEVERLRAEQPPGDDGAAAEEPAQEQPPPRRPRTRRRPRRMRRIVATALVAAAAVSAALALAAWISEPSLAASGPRGVALVGRDAPPLVFSVSRERVRWLLDGRDVTSRATQAGGRSSFSAGGLPDGRHRLSVSASGGFLWGRARKEWRFTVDTTPPRLALPPAVRFTRGRTPLLRGRARDAASVTVDGRRVQLRGDRFAVAVGRRPVFVRALDAAGNASARRLRVELVPRRPPAPLRAVHVTAYGWADAALRRGVLDLVDRHRIDAVELDLKDESGVVGFAPPIPLARRIGSAQRVYDLRAAIALLHRKGVRVIGRLVCFRDPILAAAAWKAGERGQVIQTPAGGPYAGYGGFTNFADETVRRYQIDVARAAAAAGIDEILYDYVRRPDGPLASMVFPGLRGTPEHAIVTFLAETRRGLARWPHVFVGASVFGVAATRPLEVAQDIPAMARQVDYVAPMVYPSHWGPGEYGVRDPNAQPYEIVLRSLRDFQHAVRGSGARVVPWLQDFSLGVDYGPAEVRAEIRGARRAGVDEWILWDPAVTYTTAALDARGRSR